MSFCGNCGTKMVTGHSFCGACGAPTVGVAPPSAFPQVQQQPQHYHYSPAPPPYYQQGPQMIMGGVNAAPPTVIMTGGDHSSCHHDFQEKIKPGGWVWCIVCFFNPFCWLCLCRKRMVCVKCGFSTGSAFC